MEALGIVRSYDDLHAVCRARADALEMSRETIDAVAGLCSGYAGKLFGRRQIKKLGPRTMAAVLATLGLALVVIEDPEAMKRLQRGYPKRNAAQVRGRTIHAISSPS